jgi:D-psicose/D-tagatose/L-ribulose 3-epimerase
MRLTPVLFLVLACRPPRGVEAPAPPQVAIGRCVGIDALAETRAAGFDYAELGVSGIARLSDEDFEQAVARHRAVGLPTPAANGFLPATVRVTGPDVDAGKQLAYLRKAFARLARLGVHVVVFGSAGARNVPENFPRETAWQQLVDFGKRLGPEAARHGIVVAVEPLRRQESNIINTAAEGLRLVEAVAHPNFQLMVDFYHLATEREDPAIIVQARDHIRHFHFANPDGRVFPLDAAEYDYAGFFAAVRRIGFRGGLSIEATPAHGVAADGPRAVAFLHAALGAHTGTDPTTKQ